MTHQDAMFRITTALEKHAKANLDAIKFWKAFPTDFPTPASIGFTDDGEFVLEWTNGFGEVIIGFDGDGYFSYAMFENDQFVPGSCDKSVVGQALPSDLKAYFEKMKGAK